jgi:hypothetical protein
MASLNSLRDLDLPGRRRQAPHRECETLVGGQTTIINRSNAEAVRYCKPAGFFLLSHGTVEFSLPDAIPHLGPWMGGAEGEVDRHTSSYRSLLTEQGFTVTHAHVSKLALETPAGARHGQRLPLEPVDPQDAVPLSKSSWPRRAAPAAQRAPPTRRECRPAWTRKIDCGGLRSGRTAR